MKACLHMIVGPYYLEIAQERRLPDLVKKPIACTKPSNENHVLDRDTSLLHGDIIEIRIHPQLYFGEPTFEHPKSH